MVAGAGAARLRKQLGPQRLAGRAAERIGRLEQIAIRGRDGLDVDVRPAAVAHEPADQVVDVPARVQHHHAGAVQAGHDRGLEQLLDLVALERRRGVDHRLVWVVVDDRPLVAVAGEAGLGADGVQPAAVDRAPLLERGRPALQRDTGTRHQLADDARLLAGLRRVVRDVGAEVARVVDDPPREAAQDRHRLRVPRRHRDRFEDLAVARPLEELEQRPDVLRGQLRRDQARDEVLGCFQGGFVVQQRDQLVAVLGGQRRQRLLKRDVIGQVQRLDQRRRQDAGPVHWTAPRALAARKISPIRSSLARRCGDVSCTRVASGAAVDAS